MPIADEPEQLTFFDLQKEELPIRSTEEQQVLDTLASYDVLNMTPLQAFQYIYEMKEKLSSSESSGRPRINK